MTDEELILRLRLKLLRLGKLNHLARECLLETLATFNADLDPGDLYRGARRALDVLEGEVDDSS